MKCTTCNKGNCTQKSIPYVFLGENIGTFEALVCTHCGETLFEAAASDKIEAEVKRRGLWGLRSRSKVTKVGNALDIRVPKPLVDFISLKKGQEVIVEPLDRHRLQVVIG